MNFAIEGKLPVDTERRTRVKVELAKRQMTLTSLADALGVSQPYISAVVSGRKLSDKTEGEIAAVLQMPKEYLFPVRTVRELNEMRNRNQQRVVA